MSALLHLLMDGPLTLEEIDAQMTGVSTGILRSAIDRGLVVREGDRYALTLAGRQIASA